MTDKTLEGKGALITGAYRNLGPVTAETLAKYGANVVINDLDKAELTEDRDKALERIRAHGAKAAAIPADVTKSGEVSRLCREAVQFLGQVDIVVNNAGPFSKTTRELAPQMKRNGWGRIVNMCAGSAFVRNHGVYTLAKAAVQIMTESLAVELGPEITVNAIAPGQIYESLPDIHEFDPTFGERYTAKAPLKRLVTRAEVANVIALMCTPHLESMTGVTMRFDGGAEIPVF
jgi:NAD(P)-dependent dehydrogenase (short-subunit alcohol dehydrogenase family)